MYTRTKKLTDSTYSPAIPTNEAAIRSQVDGAVQEVYDMLSGTTSSSSGADYVNSSGVSGLLSGNPSTIQALLAALKANDDSILAQLQSIVLNQIPDGTVTDAKLSNIAGQIKDKLSKLYTVYDTTSSGNNYSVTVPNLASLSDGAPILVRWNADSTDVITVNPNSLGQKAVYDSFNNQVKNVKAGTISDLRYNATNGNFILLGKGGGGTAIPSDIALGKTATTDTGLITGTSTKKYAPGDQIPLANIGVVKPVLESYYPDNYQTSSTYLSGDIDSRGNYIMYHWGSSPYMTKISPAGVVLNTWTISGTGGTQAQLEGLSIDPSDDNYFYASWSDSQGGYKLGKFYFPDSGVGSLTWTYISGNGQYPKVWATTSYIYYWTKSGSYYYPVKINKSIGAEIWRSTSAFSVLYDVFYCGGNVYAIGQVSGNSFGSIIGLNDSTGATTGVNYNLSAGMYFSGSPRAVFTNGVDSIYCGTSTGGWFYKFNASLGLVWSLSDGSVSTPSNDADCGCVAADGTLYMMTGANFWTRVNSSNGVSFQFAAWGGGSSFAVAAINNSRSDGKLLIVNNSKGINVYSTKQLTITA